MDSSLAEQAPRRAAGPDGTRADVYADEKYAGYVTVALSADDYIELLPATWRPINHYGVKIGNRVYDITRVWIRNHRSSKREWITAYSKVLKGKPAPFGELAWDHALADLRARGGNPGEAEIAQAAPDLLARAHAGPPDEEPRQGRTR